MAIERRFDQSLGAINAVTEALEARDSQVRAHCDRVVDLVHELGTVCGKSGEALQIMKLAARFHDVGKIGVPDAILLKHGPLTADEWIPMREHPAIGERIFVATCYPNAAAIGKVIRHHHEAFDGSGYPDGLSGDAISLSSRILVIADAYDAMTSPRPYHAARSHAEVMGILRRESGKRIDPWIFSRFETMIETSPSRAG
jgi:HD-GYP domain-containing protein (c-di-GMP phosphodiesterase class II)